MKYKTPEKELYVSLSLLFVDTEPNYESIYEIVANFPTNVVKTAFFEFVGPYCYVNMMSPVPTVWTMFDEDALLADIQTRKNNYHTIKNRILRYFLHFYLSDLWKEFMQQLQSIEKNHITKN